MQKILIRLLVLAVGVLLLTYLWFSFNGGWSIDGIKKNDWLLFWGSYLAFVGTVGLGYISYKQNQALAQTNKDLLTAQIASSSILPIELKYSGIYQSRKSLVFFFHYPQETFYNRIQFTELAFYPPDQFGNICSSSCTSDHPSEDYRLTFDMNQRWLRVSVPLSDIGYADKLNNFQMCTDGIVWKMTFICTTVLGMKVTYDGEYSCSDTKEIELSLNWKVHSSFITIENIRYNEDNDNLSTT